jgi:plasmid stabilization system protein ParE
MAYKVKFTHKAKADVIGVAAYIARDSIQAARRWKAKLKLELTKLKEMPMQYPLAAEAEELGVECRSFNHFSHRMLYLADSKQNEIVVLRVYHGHRRPITPEGIEH